MILALNQRLPVLSFIEVTAGPDTIFYRKSKVSSPMITWKPGLNYLYLGKMCLSEKKKKKNLFLNFFGVSETQKINAIIQT